MTPVRGLAVVGVGGRNGPLAGDEISEKIVLRRGFSALHACGALAGLRSPGKGANRTILDCMFRLSGRDKAVVLPPRGPRAPAASSGRIFASVGRFRWLQMRKGLES
jgi:hypothetical protein